MPIMDQADIPALLARMSSDEDAARKMAVFKLQNSINDPSFADVFISSGGLVILRRLIMGAGGNTLAYSLQSLARLLEVDMGWDIFEGPTAGDLVERIVELVVTNPLVNILRGAMSILVALVGHSQSRPHAKLTPGTFGFRALKPAVAVHPHFFEHVVQHLRSADHALCANALMLINALIRDALSADGSSLAPISPISAATGSAGSSVPGEEWAQMIKALQDLGLIRAVHSLMVSSALQDLAHPMLEFQSLTKVLLRKWREVRVDLERPEHRRALKGLHLASAPERSPAVVQEEGSEPARKGSRRHNPEKWRRLGFETESPAQDFDVAGFLGMTDLTDYVRKNEAGFQRLLMEQAAKPPAERCPFTRASLTVTMILYEHFEVDKADLEDTKGNQGLDTVDRDMLYKPLLLQWSRLHTAGLHSLFRLWKATGAQTDDFDKVAELVRLLINQVVGSAPRTRDVLEVEEEMQDFDIGRLRQTQMDLLQVSFEETWGQHFQQVREELRQEALQFVKEQRIRCLLEGSWFSTKQGLGSGTAGWRFAKLSHNRRYLHYADFAERKSQDPTLEALGEKVDLSTISSVVSNVSTSNDEAARITENNNSNNTINKNGVGGEGDKGHARKPSQGQSQKTTTKITIYSYVHHEAEVNGTSVDGGAGQDGSRSRSGSGAGRERAILTLWPPTHSLASEWLDGLLMLLNQAPITAETNKLVKLASEYGLKIRLLNVRMDSAFEPRPVGAGVVPSRVGLDQDYFFEV